MNVYYNEIDPFAAQWLRNLIAAGHIAPGEVDERSVVDVRGGDLREFDQCHFFAGIGVWSYALRLAGWPDDRPVWSGSCPCQPFSAAGRSGGFGDERHLWPHWARLTSECRPDVIFGEQVASADGLAWLDFVCADLEAAGYAVGTVDTCAAGFGAPHLRQRLYFVATRGDTSLRREEKVTSHYERTRSELMGACPARFWDEYDLLKYSDGYIYKIPPVKSEIQLMVHGYPGRVAQLRAYGNAIVAPQAAEFIKAYMECKP